MQFMILAVALVQKIRTCNRCTRLSCPDSYILFMISARCCLCPCFPARLPQDCPNVVTFHPLSGNAMLVEMQ